MIRETPIFKTNDFPKPSCFATEDIAYNFELAQSKSITDYYFYGDPQKIQSFATMMYEGLTYGFLHYHIPSEHRAYFLEAYPELAKATNQIHYLYTAKPYRHAGNASKLLDYILQDMAERGFQYVWLRCHITPELYYSKGFLTFTEAIRQICARFDDFMSDYKEKIGAIDNLDRSFGDLRLVKICAV
jgi:GNAT superfamily N-acetyltransferase